MDLIAKITLAQGVAQLPYRLVREFGVLARITCAHQLVGFVESDASDCPVLYHLVDGIGGNVTQSFMYLLHSERFTVLC